MWAQHPFDELPCLIAEDSGDDLAALERSLRLTHVRNPRIVTCTDQETIEWLRHASDARDPSLFPAVLFLDLVMPYIGGLEVLKWLRDNPHPPLSVVIHTGVENDALLERARDLGASFYLPKGTRPEAIAEVFRRARVDWEQAQLLPT